MTSKLLLSRIADIVQIANEPRNYRDNGWREQSNRLFAAIKALDMDAGIGLVGGRHVTWHVADGYAHYIIKKVGKVFTELEYIPEGDNYEFSGTFMYRNKLVASTAVVRAAVEWNDDMKELFAKHKS